MGDDLPSKETGVDMESDVIVTHLSPGVKSWPYPDNQEGLESSASPAVTELDSVNNLMCCVCVYLLSSLLIYWFGIFVPPSAYLNSNIEDTTGPKNLRRLDAQLFSTDFEPRELFKD